jgi:hypothetical protein
VDGVLPRGTVICRASLSAKWHVFVNGTDTLAADLVRVLSDDVKVIAGLDAFAAAYFEGFFSLSAIVDANVAGGLVAADLTLVAGFHKIETDEVRLK